MSGNNQDYDPYLAEERLVNVEDIELTGFDKIEYDMGREVSKYNEAAIKRRCNV